MAGYARVNIGSQFTGESGNTLTVVQQGGYKEGKKKLVLYVVHCSVCSKDRGLYPEGSILMTRRQLRYGKSVCGCSKKPHMSEKQNTVLIKRLARSKGYIFLGWTGNYIGCRTNIKMYNPSTCNYWETLTINSFLNQGRGDPEEFKRKAGKHSIKDDDFYFASLPKDITKHLIYRNENDRYHWYHTCPVCDGVFYTSMSKLRRGIMVCPCFHSKETKGFKKNKYGYLYITKWETPEGAYLKYGITNRKVSIRVREQRNKNKKCKTEVITTYGGTGYHVSNIESEMINYFKHKREYYPCCPKSTMPDGYSETIPYNKDNLKLLKSFLRAS